MHKLLVVMDNPAAVKAYKDTTVAMLLEAQRRGYEIYITGIEAIWLENATAMTRCSAVQVCDQQDWYRPAAPNVCALADFDVILMRKDPPFNMRYIHATYMLEMAESQGVLVVNKPQALRDANEKLAALWFPAWIPDTIVSAQADVLRQFVQDQQRCVLKPLDGMGGSSIFMTSSDDPNLNVIIETLTAEGNITIMGQRYLPEISNGDIRVLIVNGEVVPFVLARIPGSKDFRGNLAKGGRGEPREISPVQMQLAEAVAPVLKRRGIVFAGIDVIGDRLTEVNVTSPTCVRELDSAFSINICADLFAAIESRL